MQKLCCVRTRQHPLPVWSHKFVLSSPTHISTNSRPFLVGIVSCPIPLTGQPEGPPTGPQVQVPKNEAQEPNKTVPQDPQMPQAVTQVHQVHQGPQAMVPTVMSTTFSLGPGWSTTVLDFSDAAAVKLYNKVISPLVLKFDGEADNLAVFLASVKDHCNCFNWSNLITIPLADTTTRNLLTHYGQVTLSNCTDHGSSYVSTQTRDAQNNNMLYYFLVDSLESKFRAKVLLCVESHSTNNVVVASALLKQTIQL